MLACCVPQLPAGSGTASGWSLSEICIGRHNPQRVRLTVPVLTVLLTSTVSNCALRLQDLVGILPSHTVVQLQRVSHTVLAITVELGASVRRAGKHLPLPVALTLEKTMQVMQAFIHNGQWGNRS